MVTRASVSVSLRFAALCGVLLLLTPLVLSTSRCQWDFRHGNAVLRGNSLHYDSGARNLSNASGAAMLSLKFKFDGKNRDVATEDKVKVLLKQGWAPVLVATLTRGDGRKLKINVDASLLGADLRLLLQAEGLSHDSDFFRLQKAKLRTEYCADGQDNDYTEADAEENENGATDYQDENDDADDEENDHDDGRSTTKKSAPVTTTITTTTTTTSSSTTTTGIATGKVMSMIGTTATSSKAPCIDQVTGDYIGEGPLGQPTARNLIALVSSLTGISRSDLVFVGKQTDDNDRHTLERRCRGHMMTRATLTARPSLNLFQATTNTGNCNLGRAQAGAGSSLTLERAVSGDQGVAQSALPHASGTTATAPPQGGHDQPGRAVQPTPRPDPLAPQSVADPAHRQRAHSRVVATGAAAANSDPLTCPIAVCRSTRFATAALAFEHAAEHHYCGSATRKAPQLLPEHCRSDEAQPTTRSWPDFYDELRRFTSVPVGYACPSCGSKFKKSSRLVRHIGQNHRGQGLLPCTGCSQFFNPGMLRPHQQGCHLYRHRPEPALSNPTKCKWGKCALILPNAVACYRHIVQYHVRPMYTCQNDPVNREWQLAGTPAPRRPGQVLDSVAAACSLSRHVCMDCRNTSNGIFDLRAHYSKQHAHLTVEHCNSCDTLWPTEIDGVKYDHVCHLPSVDDDAAAAAWQAADEMAAFPTPCVAQQAARQRSTGPASARQSDGAGSSVWDAAEADHRRAPPRPATASAATVAPSDVAGRHDPPLPPWAAASSAYTGAPPLRAAAPGPRAGGANAAGAAVAAPVAAPAVAVEDARTRAPAVVIASAGTLGAANDRAARGTTGDKRALFVARLCAFAADDARSTAFRQATRSMAEDMGNTQRCHDLSVFDVDSLATNVEKVLLAHTTTVMLTALANFNGDFTDPARPCHKRLFDLLQTVEPWGRPPLLLRTPGAYAHVLVLDHAALGRLSRDFKRDAAKAIRRMKTRRFDAKVVGALKWLEEGTSGILAVPGQSTNVWTRMQDYRILSEADAKKYNQLHPANMGPRTSAKAFIHVEAVLIGVLGIPAARKYVEEYSRTRPLCLVDDVLPAAPGEREPSRAEKTNILMQTEFISGGIFSALGLNNNVIVQFDQMKSREHDTQGGTGCVQCGKLENESDHEGHIFFSDRQRIGSDCCYNPNDPPETRCSCEPDHRHVTAAASRYWRCSFSGCECYCPGVDCTCYSDINMDGAVILRAHSHLTKEIETASARGFLSIRAANAQLAARPNFKLIPPMDLICQAAGCAATTPPRDAFACCYAKLPANGARGRLTPGRIELVVPFCPLKNETWHTGEKMGIVLRPPEGREDDFVTVDDIRTLTVQAMKKRPELR